MKLTCWRISMRLAGSLLVGVAALSALSSSASGELMTGQRLPSIPTSSNISLRQTKIGSVTSQGDAVMNAPLVRSNFGVNGAGIKIGIISDSFNFLGGMNAGIASGDLPGPGNPNGFVTAVNIVKDDNDPSSSDEGRGMAELIHDVAPGAQLLFHSAFNNTNTSPGQTIAGAINNLVAAGANIIVDDVGWLTAPQFQDGRAAQAAKAAFAAGVPYFSSAGNDANNAYQAVFNPLGLQHNFDANNNEVGVNKQLLRFSIPNNQIAIASLWWDDPYPSLGGGTVQSDYDFGIFDIAANAFVSTSVDDQAAGGADPVEFVGFQNTSGATRQYGLVVERFTGPAKLLKIGLFGQPINDDDDTNSPTIFGHSAAEGVVSVAASSVFSPNTPESFTSLGPTTILYDTAGNKLANQVIRNTPLITGPDGGNTTFFGFDVANDADTFPNFFGTSAAAPHVAAVAALLMERAADLGIALTPTQIYNILFNSTVDIGAPGYDNLTGHGRLDAFLALSKVPEPATVAMLLIAMGWFASGQRRRRDG